MRQKIIFIALMLLTGAATAGALNLILPNPPEKKEKIAEEEPENDEEPYDPAEDPVAATLAASPAMLASGTENCTLKNGALLLINPNFTVGGDFIAARRAEMTDLTDKYDIREGVPGNGQPLLDPIAAEKLYEMLSAYSRENPGHTIETRSCFRSVGTGCGRLCYATGTSDHHSGYTCDLVDPAYGDELNTDYYDSHREWQWLHANSYKYGFIDRFPSAWTGGPMTAPVNLTAEGSTGLYETWHYRYVGVAAATEIATGKYNNGNYDSLEHYLLARGFVTNLLTGACK